MLLKTRNKLTSIDGRGISFCPSLGVFCPSTSVPCAGAALGTCGVSLGLSFTADATPLTNPASGIERDGSPLTVSDGAGVDEGGGFLASNCFFFAFSFSMTFFFKNALIVVLSDLFGLQSSF